MTKWRLLKDQFDLLGHHFQSESPIKTFTMKRTFGNVTFLVQANISCSRAVPNRGNRSLKNVSPSALKTKKCHKKMSKTILH